MAFNILNLTKRLGIGIGAFGLNMAVGFVEEISSNFTSPANAIDRIPMTDGSDTKILPKKWAYGIAAALASSGVRGKIVDVISGATFNLLI